MVPKVELFSHLPESRAKPFQYLQEIEEEDEEDYFGDDISRLTSVSNMSRHRARNFSSSTIRICDSNLPSRNNSMLRLDSMHTVVLNHSGSSNRADSDSVISQY